MMARSESEIEQSALQIPAKARLRLAAKLLASVPDSSYSAMNESEALDLAEKRAADLDGGEIEALDYRQEMSRIRASISR